MLMAKRVALAPKAKLVFLLGNYNVHVCYNVITVITHNTPLNGNMLFQWLDLAYHSI